MTNFLKLGILECAHDGWFKKNLRVSRNTFSWIVDRLTAYSEQHDCFKRGPNAFVDMPMGVAMTLSYLSQESGYLHTASLFGIAKSTAIKVINSILDIIIAISPQVIKFPGTEGVWKQIGNEFEANCGFPDVAGAVDGTIFQIERPFDYDGWICRKGFAAINMQATVDSQGRFMEYSVRAGSCSDKNVWKMSSIGRMANSIIPKMMHFLGDAGYTLSSSLLTPYTIYPDMPRDEKTYNYLHSRSRIVIEQAFGGLKGRWRILKRTLNMKTPASCARTIVACMVLHNLTIDIGDDVQLDDRIDPFLHQHIRTNTDTDLIGVDRFAKRDNIKEYLSML